MKIIEIETLLERWHTLLNDPIDVNINMPPAIKGILQERLDILHRLNGLGESSVDDASIVELLEKTNVLLRDVDKIWKLVKAH